MKKIYLMTAVTLIVTIAVLSQMRSAEAFAPAGPGLRQRLHAAARKTFRRLRRLLDNLVAAGIAYREHHVTLSALRNLSDTELKDFGVYRGSPRSAFHRYRDVKFTSPR